MYEYRRLRGKSSQITQKIDRKLRLALASVWLLSNIAVSQTAKQVGIVPPDSATCLSMAASPSLDVCAQEDRFPIKLNQTAKLATAATSSNLPDAPSASWVGPNSTDRSQELLNGTSFVPPTLLLERNTNKSWHTLDTKFIVLQTLSTIALFADIETTTHALAAQPRAIELNPLFGQHPTPARVYGTAIPLHAFAFYLSYRAKKLAPRRNVWTFAPTLLIAVHIAAAINNLIVAHQ
jgi:hypothetical protein